METLQPAPAAEAVQLRVPVGSVSDNGLGAQQESEARGRDEEVPVLLLPAQPAAAIHHAQVFGGPDGKADRAVVAAAGMVHQAGILEGVQQELCGALSPPLPEKSPSAPRSISLGDCEGGGAAYIAVIFAAGLAGLPAFFQ